MKPEPEITEGLYSQDSIHTLGKINLKLSTYWVF